MITKSCAIFPVYVMCCPKWLISEPPRGSLDRPTGREMMWLVPLVYDIVNKRNSFDSQYKISLVSVHPPLVASMEKLPKKVTSTLDELPLERLRLMHREGVKTRFVYEVLRLCEALLESAPLPSASKTW